MNNFKLTSFLTSNVDLDEKMLNELIANFKIKHFRKGEYLLQQGEVCTNYFFIETGLARLFGINRVGKEHIIQFAPEGWFVSDRESTFFKQPSSYFIQAIEDTKAFLLDEQFILKLSESNPAFVEFNNKLLHNHIRNMTKRVYQLLSATAEERYLAFTKTYPDILLRVPQIMVASYLGITPESLSRVRKDLALKNFKK
ncbi:Crp/Fnr family transcriptional regulator [Xanthovirga aplysinae]|uniref:Crp/Fnr family transcriptional regulator n=1 Tax=Xanthovirga aplysinae TaxID=2529853 RepID=UPI0012BC5EED|nr:Crp/Fnr family transcriptional regulator [Xanthovirga aplysinae]MTI33262.1 Crp/Fnr family transcriptional regulator [Xanthovirga aplysinae]